MTAGKRANRIRAFLPRRFHHEEHEGHEVLNMNNCTPFLRELRVLRGENWVAAARAAPWRLCALALKFLRFCRIVDLFHTLNAMCSSSAANSIFCNCRRNGSSSVARNRARWQASMNANGSHSCLGLIRANSRFSASDAAIATARCAMTANAACRPRRWNQYLALPKSGSRRCMMP